MSTAPGDEYQPTSEGVEGSTTSDTLQNDYKSRTGQSHIPVQSDEAPIEDPIDPNSADSDETLGLNGLPTIDP